MADLATNNGIFWGVTLACFAFLFVLGKPLSLPLYARVLAGLVLGGAVGYIFKEQAAVIKPIGDAFVQLIRMLVIPLIFTTLVSGVVAMGDPKKLGSLGLKTILLYMFTTVIAVCLGLALGTWLQPGIGIDYQSASADVASNIALSVDNGRGLSLTDRLLAIIPSNPLKAMVETDVLATILFAILFGAGILVAEEKGRIVGEVIESAADAVLKVTGFVMWVAPFGVFALMAWVLGTQGLGILANLGKLTLALYAACALQIIFVYGGIVRIILGLPFVRFISGILDAMSTAYSTASSAATLPVTIANVSNNLGVKKSVAGSVLPLGATINMDGTSIYLGLIALFASQALGMSLTMADYVLIAFTATMASIGAAGIPSASLFLAVTVLSVFNVPEEAAVLIVAFIFPFDRILDMMRTMTNVTGDAAVAVAVGKWEGALDEDVFRSKKKS